MDTWSAVEVADWIAQDGDLPSEPLGTKEKFWVSDPQRQQWLFKFARDPDGRVRGEDWAECLVHELAILIHVPTATVQIATCDGRRGVLSRSVVGPDQRLEHGNELLARANPTYDRAERRENPGYTISAVKASLEGVGPPDGRDDLREFSGFDVWCAYLLLDAWVAGRDRHHENWAVIADIGRFQLAPSFDHGNALGFQERESRYVELANETARLTAWARRGRSPHFAGRPRLVELAHSALEQANSQARQFWLENLARPTEDEIAAAVSRVPEALLSEAGRNFCLQLLAVNRERVLHGDQDFA